MRSATSSVRRRVQWEELPQDGRRDAEPETAPPESVRRLLKPRPTATILAGLAAALIVPLLAIEPADSGLAEESLPVRAVKTIPVRQAASAQARPTGVAPVSLSPIALAEDASTEAASTQAAPASAPPSAAGAVGVEPLRERWAGAFGRPKPKLAAKPGAAEPSPAAPALAAFAEPPAADRFAAHAMAPLLVDPPVAPDPAQSAPGVEQDKGRDGRAVRIASGVNLRAKPSRAGRVLGTLAAGSSAVLFGCRSGWCEIEAGERRGYVAESYLKGRAAAREASRPVKAAFRKKRGAVAKAPAKAGVAELPGVAANPLMLPKTQR